MSKNKQNSKKNDNKGKKNKENRVVTYNYTLEMLNKLKEEGFKEGYKKGKENIKVKNRKEIFKILFPISLIILDQTLNDQKYLRETFMQEYMKMYKDFTKNLFSQEDMEKYLKDIGIEITKNLDVIVRRPD